MIGMGKKLTITESELRKIIREEVNKILDDSITNNAEYHLNSSDELSEYMWLKPNITGLDVDVFVDDGGSFIRQGHNLVLFARNGIGRNCNSFIPFSIEPKPRVTDSEMDFNVSYDVIFSIQDFIQNNLGALINLANGKISQELFVQSLVMNRSNLRFVGESKNILFEMATLRVKDSGLPMDIWLDEGATYQGHAPRIKFRASNEQRTTHEFSSMILSKPPTIENLPDNSPLRKKDIEKLKRFVINNFEALRRLADGEIDFLTEFKPNMILD